METDKDETKAKQRERCMGDSEMGKNTKKNLEVCMALAAERVFQLRKNWWVNKDSDLCPRQHRNKKERAGRAYWSSQFGEVFPSY